MTIILYTVENKQIMVKDAIEFNFTQSIDAACDSFWAVFLIDTFIGEIQKVVALKNNNIIFSGYCDCQKMSQYEKGYKVYFYARSMASVLVDNEAQPVIYEKPSAKQLVFSLAQCYGYVSKLPEIYSDSSYEIQKGASCYGAISKFVRFMTGMHIYVTPEKEIICISESDDVIDLDKYDVLSSRFIINRSEPCTKINFKKQSSDASYSLHTKAQVGDDIGIERQKYVNLSAVPQWQRENIILDTIKSSFENYRLLEIVVNDYVKEPMLQRFNYRDRQNDFGEFVLVEKQYKCDKSGNKTKLTLRKNIDVEEITYVD